jgi:hypothetical protein
MKKLVEILKESISNKVANIDGDNIHIIGFGVYAYDGLKRDVLDKLKDLESRLSKDDFLSIGPGQLDVLSKFWLALAEYEKIHKEKI